MPRTGDAASSPLRPPQIPGVFPNRVITNREGEVVVGSGSGRKEDNPPLSTSTSSLLSSFASDNSKLADAINLFLKDPNPEDAQDLIDALPDLVPDDPALAAVIAEEMAKAMGGDDASPSHLANSECRSDDPARCRVHGTPQPRKIRQVKSSPKADDQARALGYSGGVKEMMSKAESSDAETVSKIQEGFSGRCKAHDAIAVISEDKHFKDAEGNDVHFGDDIIEHYVEGRRRRNNEPKVDNLCDLPFAIKAVKTDSYGVSRLKYPKGAAPDPLDPPRGTQREYHITTDRGPMNVYVYIKGGVINGWHVEDKK